MSIIEVKMLLRLVAILITLAVGVPADSTDDLIQGIRNFTGNLYRELIKNNPNQNIIFSPMTIQKTMSLLMSATENENLTFIQELRNAVSLPYSSVNTREAFKNVSEELNRNDDDLKIFDAAKIYIMPYYFVQPWYRQMARDFYKTDIETINFRQPSSAAENINRWVARKTNNKIINFIDFYDIPANTNTLLIDTLYLSGNWAKCFQQKNIIWGNFNSPNGSKRVKMITHQSGFLYYEDVNAQYLEIPMLREGSDAAMVLVLPQKQQGLTQTENNIQNFLKPLNFTYKRVNITIPKFSLSNNMKLKSVLQNMGVREIFQFGMPLTGLRNPRHPFTKLSDVLQKTSIDVNEWGVNGREVTCAEAVLDGPFTDLKTFTADHPFLFYITVDEVIVHAGRVMQV